VHAKVKLSLLSDTDGATIYYSLDGSEPGTTAWDVFLCLCVRGNVCLCFFLDFCVCVIILFAAVLVDDRNEFNTKRELLVFIVRPNLLQNI
jgi:hypothetical protein